MREISHKSNLSYFSMIKFEWNKLAFQIKDFIETEEWIQVSENEKQRMLLDLKDPRNMETTLRYSKGCDLVKLKIYRPTDLTKMSKFEKWIFIPRIAQKIDEFEIGTDVKSAKKKWNQL